MADGWDIRLSELDKLVKKLNDAGANMESVSRKAIAAVYPLVSNEMSEQMPRSKPGKMRKTTAKEPWRMQSHAADSSRFKERKLRVSINKRVVYSIVGPNRLPAYTSTADAIRIGGRHFYMWYVGRGRPLGNGTFLKGNQYVRRTSEAVRVRVSANIRLVLLKELGLYD